LTGNQPYKNYTIYKKRGRGNPRDPLKEKEKKKKTGGGYGMGEPEGSPRQGR
jgi:hypothetical protein